MRLDKKVRIAGTAFYQEAVFQKLGRTGADTLLLLEHLPGPDPFLTFLEKLRLTYPNVRIIVLLKAREAGSSYARKITDLGIYDLLMKNPNLSELEDLILHPRTYKDVQAIRDPIGAGEEEEPEGALTLPGNKKDDTEGTAGKTEEKAEKPSAEVGKQSFLSGFFGALFKKKEKQRKDADSKKAEKKREKQRRVKKKSKQEKEGKEETHAKQEPQLIFKERTKEQPNELPVSGPEPSGIPGEEERGEKRSSMTIDFEKELSREEERRREAEDKRIRQKEESRHEAEVLSEELSELRDRVKFYERREQQQEGLRREMERKLMEGEAEIARLQARRVDCSMDYPPLSPYDGDFFQKEGVLLFTGLKGGVGTTSIALSMAAAFAEAGEKTILLELGNPEPLLNPYFNFSRVPYGFFEALDAIKIGETDALGRAILRPGKLSPKSRSLFEVYRKLPEGLHLLLYSNKSLEGDLRSLETGVQAEDLLSLKRMLESRYGYSKILLDVSRLSPLWETILSSTLPINRITAVAGQDIGSLFHAGSLIRSLAKRPEGRRRLTLFLNRYDGTLPLRAEKIRKELHLKKEDLLLFPEDREGFLLAEKGQVPYLFSKGTYGAELRNLARELDNN